MGAGGWGAAGRRLGGFGVDGSFWIPSYTASSRQDLIHS